jgi:chemotaxis protein methyltransferase CheR
MSVAAVQSHLQDSNGIEQIEIGPYLTKLSAGLASSMVGPRQDIEIVVVAGAGALPSSYAVSLGLIVTELIMNAVKYAFPKSRSSARIDITFEKAKADWKLTVSDNGIGRSEVKTPASTGLGTALIGALTKQLEAQISEVSTDKGLAVEITRATFVSRLPGTASRGRALERQQ